MNTEQVVHTHDADSLHYCGIKCVSWSAVIAGALVGIGLSFLLELFSISLGLAAFDASREGMITLAIGGVIALLFGAIVAMFAAGWVTGFLARPHCVNRKMGVLYGFVMWSLAFILMVLLASNVHQFVSTHYYALFKPNAAVVNMTSNLNGAVEQTTTRSSTGETRAKQINIDTEKGANILGMSLFLTFAIFFVGAISSCIGAYYGICRCDKNEDINLRRNRTSGL